MSNIKEKVRLYRLHWPGNCTKYAVRIMKGERTGDYQPVCPMTIEDEQSTKTWEHLRIGPLNADAFAVFNNYADAKKYITDFNYEAVMVLDVTQMREWPTGGK